MYPTIYGQLVNRSTNIKIKICRVGDVSSRDNLSFGGRFFKRQIVAFGTHLFKNSKIAQQNAQKLHNKILKKCTTNTQKLHNTYCEK